ncbi:MAG: hypothetical protein DDT20_01723 [Firmicutes bacterium]|nr:hypothetical protein [Bacillota bacterium]
MGLIGMGCVIGITLLVRPDAVGWVSVGSLLAVGFLSCIRREAAEKKLLKSGINEIDKLTGEGFERFLALYFKAQGYNAKITPEFGDFGADLILVKDGATTIVQAKRWENAVGIEAVQQIVAAKAYYKAERAMVVTNSAFTPAAIKLAEVNRVELWERSALIERLSEASAADLLPASDVRSAPDRTCLECGRLLVERTGPTGRFRGCSGFPLCTYTSDAH